MHVTQSATTTTSPRAEARGGEGGVLGHVGCARTGDSRVQMHVDHAPGCGGPRQRADQRSSAAPPGPDAGPVAANLTDEVSLAAAGVVERVLAHLCGRIYSPRIKLLDIAQLGEAAGLAPSTIYQLVAEGEFPAPIKIGRQNKWRESTLIAWLDRREAKIEG